MSNSRSDFAEFAERCKNVARILREAEQACADMRPIEMRADHYETRFVGRDGFGESVTLQECCEVLDKAERHARLLETIRETVALTKHLSLTGDAYSRGVAQAHANIRSLLEQS